jgi:hypothetical protein
MAQQNRIAHAKLMESLHEQSRLGCRGPKTQAGALAVAEAWPVKAENTIAAGKTVNKPANREILDHRAVAMEQYHAESRGITTIEIMKSYTLALCEGANRWALPFSHD